MPWHVRQEFRACVTTTNKPTHTHTLIYTNLRMKAGIYIECCSSMLFVAANLNWSYFWVRYKWTLAYRRPNMFLSLWIVRLSQIPLTHCIFGNFCIPNEHHDLNTHIMPAAEKLEFSDSFFFSSSLTFSLFRVFSLLSFASFLTATLLLISSYWSNILSNSNFVWISNIRAYTCVCGRELL